MPFLTCTPQKSHRPPSWAGSQGLGARLLSLSLWIAQVIFLFTLTSNLLMPQMAAGLVGTTWIFAAFVPLDEAQNE